MFIKILFSSGTWSLYLMDVLSLRLGGLVGARNYVRSSFSQWVLSISRTWTQDLSILSVSGQTNVRCVTLTLIQHTDTARTARTYGLEVSVRLHKSPECVRTRRLEANCTIARKIRCSDRLMRWTFTFYLVALAWFQLNWLTCGNPYQNKDRAFFYPTR